MLTRWGRFYFAVLAKINLLTLYGFGKIYSFRFIGDSDLRVSYRVAARTARTVTFETLDGSAEALWNHKSKKAFRINAKKAQYFGHEVVNPYGSYSMAPSLHADRVG